jgi:hypothetical protein
LENEKVSIDKWNHYLDDMSKLVQQTKRRYSNDDNRHLFEYFERAAQVSSTAKIGDHGSSLSRGMRQQLELANSEAEIKS